MMNLINERMYPSFVLLVIAALLFGSFLVSCSGGEPTTVDEPAALDIERRETPTPKSSTVSYTHLPLPTILLV